MSAVVHIAGPDVQVGVQLRQRCAWCGALLLDYALDRIAVPVAQAALPGGDRPATWPVGDLVAVDGSAQYVVPHADGAQLPDGACARLDTAVTA